VNRTYSHTQPRTDARASVKTITHNPSWSNAVMRYLQGRFPETKFDFIAAGSISSSEAAPQTCGLDSHIRWCEWMVSSTASLIRILK
jgi:hypothetical protein